VNDIRALEQIEKLEREWLHHAGSLCASEWQHFNCQVPDPSRLTSLAECNEPHSRRRRHRSGKLDRISLGPADNPDIGVEERRNHVDDANGRRRHGANPETQ
jgi:hypothetical protein